MSEYSVSDMQVLSVSIPFGLSASAYRALIGTKTKCLHMGRGRYFYQCPLCYYRCSKRIQCLNHAYCHYSTYTGVFNGLTVCRCGCQSEGDGNNQRDWHYHCPNGCLRRCSSLEEAINCLCEPASQMPRVNDSNDLPDFNEETGFGTDQSFRCLCGWTTSRRDRFAGHVCPLDLIPSSKLPRLKGTIVSHQAVFVRGNACGSDHRLHVYQSRGRYECSRSTCNLTNGVVSDNDVVFECDHIRCAKQILSGNDSFCQAGSTFLFSRNIDERILRSIPQDMFTKVLDLFEEARDLDLPFIVECSERASVLRNFSVYAYMSGERVNVRYFGNDRRWICSGSGCDDHRCVHISACKCVTERNQHNYNSEGTNDVSQTDYSKEFAYAEYIQREKVIQSPNEDRYRRSLFQPVIHSRDKDSILIDLSLRLFRPSETICPLPGCQGDLLNFKAKLNAPLFCIFGRTFVETRVLRCSFCSLSVHYKDADKGVLNFDSKLLISHCLLEQWYF